MGRCVVLWVGMGNGLLVEAGAQGVLRLKLGARLPAKAGTSIPLMISWQAKA